MRMKVPKFLLNTLLVKSVGLAVTLAVSNLATAIEVCATDAGVAVPQNSEESEAFTVAPTDPSLASGIARETNDLVEPRLQFHPKSLPHWATRHIVNQLPGQIDAHANGSETNGGSKLSTQIDQQTNRVEANGSNELSTQIDQQTNRIEANDSNELLTQIDQQTNRVETNGSNELLNQIDQYANGVEANGSNELLNQIDQYANGVEANGSNELLNQIDQYANEDNKGNSNDDETKQVYSVSQLANAGNLALEGDANDDESEQLTSVSQVTSVSQLADVQPDDWAFQALQSLVERYGVIAGYPDSTFRGNRALTRYEFAAGLNAALDRVNELVAARTADRISQEDLVTLEKLQEEFTPELAVLGSRIETLEARTAQLQAQSFSPTSRLIGLAFFNVTGLAGSEGTLRETGVRSVLNTPLTERIEREPNVTASGLVWLNIGTSFTGKDLLITQLAAGQGISPANLITSQTSSVNNTGIPFTDAGAFLGPGAPVVLRELAYEFPVFGKARLVIGPRINWFRFFDINRFTFFLNGTTSLNAIANPLTNEVRRGAGAILQLPLSNQFDLNLAYLAEANEFVSSNSASNPFEGLFGGTNSITAELAYKPSPAFNIRFLYNRLNSQARRLLVNGSTSALYPNRVVSGVPINGIADDGAGGSLDNAQSDIFEVNFDWRVAKGIGLFGRYGYADTNLNAAISSRDGSITTQTFQVGLAFPDLFKEGAQATLSFLMPFNYTSGRKFLTSGGGDGGTQYELEGTYYLPLTNNIALIPNVQVIFNLNNFESNPTIYVINLRTQFSF